LTLSGITVTTPPLLAYADGPDAAAVSPRHAAMLAGLDEYEVLLGWTPEPCDWLAEPALRGRAVMAGYALAPAIADGRLQYLPVRLSMVPRLVEDALRPEVAVVRGVPRGSALAFAGSVGWGAAAARAADRVVVEIDARATDLGGPVIPGNIVATVDRPAPGPVARVRRPDAVDRAIGRTVVSVLPDGATLQLGPGAIADAVVSSLDRAVAIWSGLLTDRVAELATRELLVGRAVAAYTWGGAAIGDLATAGRLRLVPVEESHDPGRLAEIDGFVACNTALQVGLDGAVNVERVAGRLVAGIGGHADFCAGASRSRGGLSVIALRSTTRGGVSTIVATVDVVSTPRCDVELVVTEHGVADLRGVDDDERAHRLIAVAAPEHRDSLALAAAAAARLGA
jgi:acyl-CoA hydrolase